MIGVRNLMPGVVYAPPERLAGYVQTGELGFVTLVEALWRSFEIHAQRTALYSVEGDLSYAALDELTDRFAGALSDLGLRPLDRVLFQSANSVQLIAAVVGCLKAGLVPVCTLAGHRESEIGFLGRHTEARAHIVQGDDEKFDLEAFALRVKADLPDMRHVISLRGVRREGVLRFEDLVGRTDALAARSAVRAMERDPFQVAVFQLSGGTSGVPKVIPRMHNEYLLNARRGAEILGFRSDDIMFMPMPMMHNASMGCMWLPTLLSGAAFAVPLDMTPQAWGAVFRRSQPTWAGFIRALIPRFDAMIDHGFASIDSVCRFWTPDAARLVREKYGKPAIGMFGMSEGLNMYPGLDAPREALDWTAGVPLSPLDEVRLVEQGGTREVGIGEVGEMECRGPYTISGYYKAEQRNAEAFTADGFYKTGDLMIRREINGKVYYAFAGRTKDLVDRGHEKVNCEEVETAVSTHPAVAGCAVVGMPDPVLGERICVYVVVRHGMALPSPADLGAHLQRVGLAKFKWPERVELVVALPLTKVGKLDKAALRADIRSKLAAAHETVAASETRFTGANRKHMISPAVKLDGVHHTARPTWRLKETVEFYRNVLGLPLVHAIAARGWGAANHPDFLHFFFDSGNGSTIAFFYYLGDEQPQHLVHRPVYDSDAIHTAWRVKSREELLAWRARLEAKNVQILYQIEHEVIESLYFRDPNGYFVEITLPLRPLVEADARDAEMTMAAAIAEEGRRMDAGMGRLKEIESVWRAKGDLVEAVST